MSTTKKEKTDGKTQAKTIPSAQASGKSLKSEKILSLFTNRESDAKTFTILFTQPDPDAMACALAMKAFVSSQLSNTTINILYSGDFAHPQNRAMVNVFGLDKHLTKLSNEVQLEGYLILVDSSELKDSRLKSLGIDSINPLIVIDHHRTEPIDETNRFVWVDDTYGAASTMCFELLNEIDYFGIQRGDIDFKQDIQLASILALGIYTDTDSLKGASPQDCSAYAQLISINEVSGYITKLGNYPLPFSYFAHFQSAINNMERYGESIVTDIGHIDSRDGDDLSTIADELMRMDGVTFVVVWAITDKGYIRASVRNDNITVTLNEFIREKFGDGGAKFTPDMRGEGGFLVPIAPRFPNIEITDELKEQEIITIRLLFKAVLQKVEKSKE